MFDLFENVIDLAQSKKTGSGSLPFGETTTVKEVLAECQPEYVASEGVFVLMGESDIAVGEKYTVNWNGADYECVAVSAPNNSIALGNMSAMGGDNTGEPFLIAYNIDASAWSFIDMTGSTTLTISIRQEVTEVKKISGKYVEGMGYVETSEFTVIPEQTITASADAHVNVSAEHAVSAGDPVTVIWDGVSFERVAAEIKGVACVGNAALGGMGEDTGEPFLIGFMGATAMVFVKTDGAVSVGVTYYSETIHPIDQKFLPSGGLGGNVVTAIFKSSDYDNFISGIAPAAADAHEVEYSCENMSFAEAVEAVLGGKVLECYFKFVNDSQAVSMPFVPRFYIDSDMGQPRIKLTPVYAELWNGDKTELIWYNNGSKDSVV